MPRAVDLRLRALIKQRAPGTTQRELAKALGIGRAAVSAYLENRWTVLDRTVLERMADFLECDASELLETTESSFFAPFRALSGKEPSPGNPFCIYITRPDADVVTAGRGLAHRDHNAMGQIEKLLRENIDRVTGREVAAVTALELQAHIQQNCVVIGSPRRNPATEWAIAYAFGTDPLKPAASAELPFAFRHLGTASTSCRSVLESSQDGKGGIWMREENRLLEIGYWPKEDYWSSRIPRGRDGAVIVVLNHEPHNLTGCFRKLIVLAGFHGAGTDAAATALVDHYRDLEPTAGERLVWGVIDVFYRKKAHSTTREDVRYQWRYRAGGRCPIALVTR